MACKNIGGCTSLKCDPCHLIDQKQNNSKTSDQMLSRHMESCPNLENDCPWIRNSTLNVGGCNIDDDSLSRPRLTDLRHPNQLFARVYQGPPNTSYGQGVVEIEDRIKPGYGSRNTAPCKDITEINYNRNHPSLERTPQGVILPVDLKVGIDTRTMMKNFQYNQKCFNKSKPLQMI